VEADIQKGLESGVVHYGNSPNPGEQGNTVILGHSASNIFNRGKFKFAFLLLKSLEIGDTFTINKDGKQYVYKVFEKKVVEPTDVSVLGPSSKPVTATLITCDPPGLSIRRLIIVGEQIAPDPTANIASSVDPAKLAASPGEIPNVTQTLWSRLKDWIF
jgi:sortase A